MNDKHIFRSFDRDLESIQARVLRLGGLVEVALEQAAKALQTHDVSLAETVRKGDCHVDDLDHAIRVDAARLLAMWSPTASDLRSILCVMDISSHLERCGDHARNIARRTIIMAEEGNLHGPLLALRRMSRFVKTMLGDALDAYVQRDLVKARDVIARDIEADQFYDTIFRSLLMHMMENHRNVEVGMHLHFIAKHIERVGDHATAIAEQTIYLVTGGRPADDRPKHTIMTPEIQESVRI
ncbi:phosphate signaling complex protein PhoU [Yoonia sp.]|uniref:phosphate signaling complex protein PhoU n=1 Tax=Yoonia sp. TaxID=2212373 RepID=UPI0019FA13B6|nr:phosphate signaling complex protein PhoU [Yoonia sp.]MBE0412178.1 phosphate signaling complex protein PhoU [Yoonia sp.]